VKAQGRWVSRSASQTERAVREEAIFDHRGRQEGREGCGDDDDHPEDDDEVAHYRDDDGVGDDRDQRKKVEW